MKRIADKHLINWKKEYHRNVLLIRGARQVGKTFSVRVLGKAFKHFLEVNFEEHPEIKSFFDGSLSPGPICEKLSGYFGIPIEPGNTLLFFDEIQACPNCIRGLRFFKEKLPGLHVIAAGSLLEFVLKDVCSFGVGRITSFFMAPMTFYEFVEAVEGESLSEMLAGLQFDKPPDEPFHRRFLELMRVYLLTGGLPEAVAFYIESRDLLKCRQMLSSLLTAYRDDFAKYAEKAPSERLWETLQSAARQVSSKFIYSSVSSGISHQDAKSSLLLLEKAGLVHRITHTSAQGIPPGSQTNPSRFKIIPFDLGICGQLHGFELSQHLIADYATLVNRGSLAEIFAGLELIGNDTPFAERNLYYWHREQRSSNAEVDYVIQYHDRIVPIEVKSGGKGAMKSMHIFLEERRLPLGIRLSQENFSRYGKIMAMPLYAAGRLRDPDFKLPQ